MKLQASGVLNVIARGNAQFRRETCSPGAAGTVQLMKALPAPGYPIERSGALTPAE
jgi:hypothetical protein